MAVLNRVRALRGAQAIRRIVSVLGLAGGLAACATAYGPAGFTGGYTDKELEPGIWRVTFSGNGYTSRETVQTYWLYHCAELAAAEGYDGFLIISNVNFSQAEDPGARGLQIAASHTVYVPTYIPSGPAAPKPTLQADIELLRGPIVISPPKVFSAIMLKAALEPYVTGNKCDNGNVCAHVHRYILPIVPAAVPQG